MRYLSDIGVARGSPGRAFRKVRKEVALVMYEAEQDTYCSIGTTVLKNKAGLRDQDELDDFEMAMMFAWAEEPLPVGLLSVTHYCRIHRHLFQDVYR